MILNLTQRVTRMSAVVLGVSPDATTDQIVERLAVLTGAGETWLSAGSRALPADPYQARAVEAARVLTCDARSQSRAVVAFLAADHKLPELDRQVVPVPDSPTAGVQLALVS